MNLPTYRITISEKIIGYRRENGLSQIRFGRLIGVSAQAVCKWEQEDCYPDIFILPHIAKILGCRVDDFFEEVVK
ncbi:MAG: helix-turn-helix domain-containing protein [Clostridia bacterium]|nr:helix-turn-helix domain-containing protein [Clostridia bacterium]